MNNKDSHHSGKVKDQIFLCFNHTARANMDTAPELSVTPAGELAGCFQSGKWRLMDTKTPATRW